MRLLSFCECDDDNFGEELHVLEVFKEIWNLYNKVLMNILLLSIILTVIKLSFKATQNLIEQLSLDLLSGF